MSGMKMWRRDPVMKSMPSDTRKTQAIRLGSCVVCFFFQAEAGIRDVAVTGVQTCALPISPHLAAGRPALVQARAPQPVSTRAVMPYVSAHAHPAAPPSQPHGAVADVHLQPVVAREPRPVHAGSAGSAQTEHTAHREERASPPARSVQSAPAKAAAAGTPMARTPDAKAATARAPAAATARAPAARTARAPAAAAKTAPAHPDNGKAHKPDAKKDAQQAHT